MAHSHSHTSSHLPEDNNARRLLYAFGVTAGFMLVEVVGGFSFWFSGIAGRCGSYVDRYCRPAFRPTRRAIFHVVLPPFATLFGWARLTTLAAFCEMPIALVVITILIVWEAIERFRTPRPVEGGMMMAIAVAGLLANILSFWLLHATAAKRKNLNVRAAALHVLGDLLGSVGAIIAALIIIWTGWTPADPILSILVSLLVLRSAWRLLKDSVNELLEGAPVSLDIAELKRRMCREIPEVRNVHHVHVWMVGEKPVMTLHVQVIPPHDHDALLDQIQHYLMDHYQIEHATIQMEYQPCHGPDCHLNEGVSGHSHHHH